MIILSVLAIVIGVAFIVCIKTPQDEESIIEISESSSGTIYDREE